MKAPLKICVIGLGSGVPSDLVDNAREIGKALSGYDNFMLLTGACNGVSYEVIKEVKKQKPSIKTIGFSPARDKTEHIKVYNYPVEYFNEIKFIGGGRQERSIRMVSQCDGVIMMGGQMGTLIEFCLAYRKGKPIGIFERKKSASDKRLIRLIERFCCEEGCGYLFFENNPRLLVSLLRKRVLQTSELT